MRVVVASGALLAVAVALALVALGWLERLQAIEAREQRNELLARVLEEHATRNIETASLALSALADAYAAGDPAPASAATSSSLAQSIAAMPMLRGVAILDSTGRVLAGSGVGTFDGAIDLARLGPLPPIGRDVLGSFVPGRGMAALAGAGTPAPPGVGFVPMVRSAESHGRPLVIVGFLNPDAFANHQQQTLDDPHDAAWLADYRGRVLAASTSAPVAPGGSVAALPAYRERLPKQEFGLYRGDGLRPGTQIVAFRASRTRPLVVMVETPQEAALAEWRTLAQALLAVGAASTLVIGAMTALAARSVRTRERAQRQRDAAQRSVAQREHELSVIVRSVQELIFRTDAEGRLTFVNARWLAATGQPTDGLIGRPFVDLVEPAQRTAAQALFAPGEAGSRSAQLRFEGGAGRRFDVTSTPLRERDRIAGFAGSAIDVTAREAAQARLRAELAFSALLVDTMPMPVSLLDRDGRYVTVNRAWEDFTGRHRDVVIGTQARRYLPPEEAEMHDAQDARLLADGGRVSYEAGFAHPDGSRRQLVVTKAAVPDAAGRPAGVLVCITDITDIREAERLTRQARDAAEEASRAKSEFIANISHELRTPLQSIIGFSELGQHRGRQHEKLAGMFGDIHASGQRMLALVNDLLDVSKLESTVGTFHLERTDLRPLVHEVTRELEPLLAARRLHLKSDLGDAPLVAKVDPLRFQQVVRNVLANAVKFSPEGAAIELAGDLGADSRIRLTVRDRGPGIPPAEIEKIFEAFVQSSKTKDGAGGTGLGLAICRKIIEAHGGRIGAENVDGGGSRFTIELPARGFAETAV